MKPVAVLGCGPAGLLAAHALKQGGHEVVIYSHKVKSEIPGSQHLQARIPEITPTYAQHGVLMVRLGTSEGYAGKVYGDPARHTGWPKYDGLYASWSVYDAYDLLWEQYSDLVRNVKITPQMVWKLLVDRSYEAIVSTLPAQVLCVGNHTFEGERYWIKQLPTPEIDAGREIVIFNGRPEDQWYRWSILGGRCSIESTMYMEDALTGLKAVSTDCNCMPEVHRLGRWAQWKHGVLLHDAYAEACVLGSQLREQHVAANV